MVNIGLSHGTENLWISQSIKNMSNYSINDKVCSIAVVSEENCRVPWDILMLNTITPCMNLTKALSAMKRGGILILNSDEKNISTLRLSKPVMLITYGFNLKACITASSVIQSEYTTIQCCIQRGFASLKNIILEPQEFSVTILEKNCSVHAVLAATTASLLLGTDPEDLNANLLQKSQI